MREREREREREKERSVKEKQKERKRGDRHGERKRFKANHTSEHTEGNSFLKQTPELVQISVQSSRNKRKPKWTRAVKYHKCMMPSLIFSVYLTMTTPPR